jgi:hypothetical protein
VDWSRQRDSGNYRTLELHNSAVQGRHCRLGAIGDGKRCRLEGFFLNPSILRGDIQYCRAREKPVVIRFILFAVLSTTIAAGQTVAIDAARGGRVFDGVWCDQRRRGQLQTSHRAGRCPRSVDAAVSAGAPGPPDGRHPERCPRGTSALGSSSGSRSIRLLIHRRIGN